MTTSSRLPLSSRRITALAVAALLALSAAACGGDDGGEESTTGDSTTTEVTSTEDVGGEETTTTTEDEAAPTTEDETTTTTEAAPAGDLSDGLLLLSDLPEGFVQESDDDETDIADGDEDGLCAGDPAGELPDPDEERGRDFESADELILVGSQVGRFGGGAAESAMQLYRDEVARCQAQDPNITLEEVAGVGDDAVTVSVSAPGDPYASRLHLARVGDVIVFVGILGATDGVLDGEALLATAVGRLAG